MKKQILNKGYLTLALTTSDGEIIGIKNDQYFNFEFFKTKKTYYLSEIFVHENGSHTIIRKGKLIVNPSNQELMDLHEQSKINLNRC